VRLLLIRHGETAHNADRLALGRADVPLNERGSLQARALAEGLAASPFGPIAAIYASPLRRAVDTATPLAEALGLTVQVEPGLIEMDIGEVEGQSFEELRQRYPDFLRVWLSDDLADAPMPGGESLRQVQERAWAAVSMLRNRHPEETVAAVTHNFVILSILASALGVDLAHFRRLRHSVAAVSVLDIRADRARLQRLNDTCHLEDGG